MRHAPYALDQTRREAVLRSIQEVCAYRAWSLLAAHVRTTHVHVVIDGQASPERIMGDFKEYASRRLSQMRCDQPERKRWARHGSTRWLNTPESVAAAMRYVVHEQGEPMSVFEENKP